MNILTGKFPKLLLGCTLRNAITANPPPPTPPISTCVSFIACSFWIFAAFLIRTSGIPGSTGLPGFLSCFRCTLTQCFIQATSIFFTIRYQTFSTAQLSSFRPIAKSPVDKPAPSITVILWSHSTFRFWKPQVWGAAIESFILIWNKLYPLHVLLSNGVISISLDLFSPCFPTAVTSAQSVQTCWSSCHGNTGERECKRERESEQTGRTSEIAVREKVINSSLLPVPRFSPVQPASACTRGCLVLLETSYISSFNILWPSGASRLVATASRSVLQGKLFIHTFWGGAMTSRCCLGSYLVVRCTTATVNRAS